MAFCARCPASQNCCTRVAHGSEIEQPFVFAEEVSALSGASKRSVEEFLDRKITKTGALHLALKSSAHGCTFFKEGRCAVYSVRPLDCRLFPFDIRRTSSGLRWIAYTSLCPINFDIDENFIAVKKLLKDAMLSPNELLNYVDSDARGMATQVFVDLGQVILDDISIPSPSPIGSNRNEARVQRPCSASG